MSYGIKTFNTSGNTTIDENLRAFVYLGKYAISAGQNDYTITCVGFPLVFFGVPYNASDNNGATGYTNFRTRTGIQINRIEQLTANTWKVSVLYWDMAANPTLYLRVFGKLNLNYPTGSAEAYGIRVWTQAGELCFDSGFKMLKLAGNSYDTEIVLTGNVPGYNDANNVADTQVTLPFNMENKSVCVNARGVINYPYSYNTYVDFDTGQTIDQYSMESFNTLFYTTGSTLVARRISTDYYTFDYAGTFIVVNLYQTVYSRVQVIDNTRFP